MDDIVMLTPERIKIWADEARQAAARYDNEWDVKAVEWDGYLTADSVVVECGSYKGRWALQIAQRYNPTLYCFEPQDWAWRTSKRVLEEYRAEVWQFGLGATRKYLPLDNYGTDGCGFSLVNAAFPDSPLPMGHINEIGEVFRVLCIPPVDLMMINIEGYEYTLIPHMFAQGVFPQRFMVQCHEGPYDDLRALTEQHYTNLWDYGRVLSAWERKS